MSAKPPKRRALQELYANLLLSIGESLTTRSVTIYQEVRARAAMNANEIIWLVDYERKIAQLPEEHQTIIHLAAQGYTQGEVASMQGCSLRTMVKKYQIYGIRSTPCCVSIGKKLGRPKKHPLPTLKGTHDDERDTHGTRQGAQHT